MKSACILTADERLRHELTLLLSAEGYTVTSSDKPSLFIVDTDTASPKDASEGVRLLTVSRRTQNDGGTHLTRPFTFDAFRAALKEAEATEVKLTLSKTESRLLALLKEAKGESVSRERLLKEVWGEDGTDALLNLYIHYLRQKLEKDGQRRIYSARGKGYFYKC